MSPKFRKPDHAVRVCSDDRRPSWMEWRPTPGGGESSTPRFPALRRLYRVMPILSQLGVTGTILSTLLEQHSISPSKQALDPIRNKASERAQRLSEN